MTLSTLYPPLGSLAHPKGSGLPAPGFVVITQEAHGTNLAIDLDTKPDDQPVHAAHDGILDYQRQPVCGNTLHVIGSGWRSGYCHVRSWETALVGKPVKAGQVIGRMGAVGTKPDGSPIGPHLHFFIATWPGMVPVYPGDFPYSLGEVSEMVIGRTPDGTRIVRVSDFVKYLTAETPILDRPNGTPIATLSRDAAVEYYGESEDRLWHQVEIGSPRYPGPVLGWVRAKPGLVQRKPVPPDDAAALEKRLAAKDVALGTIVKAGKEGLSV